MLKARHSPLPLRSSPNGTLCRAIGNNIIAKEDRNVKCELQLKKRRINAAESVFAQAFECADKEWWIKRIVIINHVVV